MTQCEYCKEPFVRGRKDQRFCNDKHRWLHHTSRRSETPLKSVNDDGGVV